MTEVKKDGDIALKHVSVGKWFILAGFMLVILGLIFWITFGEITSIIHVNGAVADDKKPQDIFVGEGGYILHQSHWAGDYVKEGDEIYSYVPRSKLSVVKSGAIEYTDMEKYEEIITSPYDGYVVTARVTPGQEINPMTAVADIDVEDNERTIITVMNYTDIGLIEEGMVVRIKPYAFPAEQYGYLTGVVTRIHDDYITETELGEYLGTLDTSDLMNADMQERYMICISVDCDENGNPIVQGAQKGVEKIWLRFGMICQLEIITHTYHPYQYLFK